MNKIISEILKIAKENIQTYLPNISDKDLDENGKVYYMNDKNGSTFDYYINKHFSPFMCFYNDKENKGALKILLFVDGKVEVYIFKNHENTPFKEINTFIKVDKKEILKLAVIMDKMEKNDKWNFSIEDMNSDIQVNESEIDEFTSQEEDYKILSELLKNCIVTKKLLEENWKVGFMQKLEETSKIDSGWFLSVGNETQEYVDNPKNLCVVTLNELCEKDPVLIPYLMDKSVGDALIRISDEEFEIDNKEKEIFLSKFK